MTVPCRLRRLASADFHSDDFSVMIDLFDASGSLPGFGRRDTGWISNIAF